MLDHLDLNVADLRRSRAFYEPFLTRVGYRRFEHGDGWCSFIDTPGSFYLVLVQTGSKHAAAGFHRKRVGVNHLAFPAPSAAAVDEMTSWLRERGVPPLYGSPLRMENRHAVFFEDPDRLKLEYVYRPAET